LERDIASEDTVGERAKTVVECVPIFLNSFFREGEIKAQNSKGSARIVDLELHSVDPLGNRFIWLEGDVA
jgi:hypothetical protein